MPKFALQLLDGVKKDGIQSFKKLFVDDVCFIDVFEKEVCKNKQYLSEYKTILAYMDFLADGNRLPQAKFKQIQDATQSNMYEFRSKHLRVYVLLLENGKVVVLAGYKATQKRDILKLKTIVKAYIASINKK